MSYSYLCFNVFGDGHYSLPHKQENRIILFDCNREEKLITAPGKTNEILWCIIKIGPSMLFFGLLSNRLIFDRQQHAWSHKGIGSVNEGVHTTSSTRIYYYDSVNNKNSVWTLVFV